MPTSLMVPTSTVVGIDWLKTVPGLPSQQINTTLPRTRDGAMRFDPWVESGFIQVNVTGGTPDTELEVSEPVYTITGWAIQPNSKKPPVWTSNDLCQRIIVAVQNYRSHRRLIGRLATRPAYEDVIVNGVWPTTEPIEVEGDEAHMAGHSFDLAMRWTRLRGAR
ncbi:hypothetical protein ACWFMI_23545 [Nocardiopsis terrae]|uniref:hypothetical protein n=1 Tax=Streptomyces sp. NPDC057554 TaxID=3350538 RepID=UPI003695F559